MLTQWSSHVKKIDFWGDDDGIQLEFLNVLDILDNLKAFRHVFLSLGEGFIPSLFAMATDMLTTTQYQLPPKPGLLS